jgi:hypothetical protein
LPVLFFAKLALLLAPTPARDPELMNDALATVMDDQQWRLLTALEETWA